MKRIETEMVKSVPVMTRVSPKVKEKLQAIAKSTKRSESFLAKEAIEAFVDVNAWQLETIRHGLDSLKRGEPGIPHERVAAWLESRGTKHELPVPTPRRRR